MSKPAATERTAHLHLRVTPEELARWKAAAEMSTIADFSEWVRQILNREAQSYERTAAVEAILAKLHKQWR